MWALGSQTQVFTLVQWVFLPTEPFSQPGSQDILKASWMVGLPLAHGLLSSEQCSLLNAVTSAGYSTEPMLLLYSYLLQLH